MDYTDQLNRLITIPAVPRRIISVVPSQTELLHDLGLNEEVIGVTKFCVHPESWFRNKTRVGGTKNLNIEKIASLRPDLIIANKEENEKQQIEELEKIAPVWISDIHNLAQALEMITAIGKVVNKKEKAKKLIEEINSEFKKLEQNASRGSNRKALYLIWHNPYMTIGTDTFIDDMLDACGLLNAVNKTRYPQLDAEELKEINPDIVLLSSEPFPFKQKHIDELQKILPSAQIELVDGEMFSWYGSRLKFAPAYFETLLRKLNGIKLM